MGTFIIRRVLQTIPLLLGISLITFFVINATGSPLANLALDPRVRPEDLANLERSLGLDKPVHERYVIWLGNVVQGDFGNSLANRLPVLDRIMAVLPNTLKLNFAALFLALIVSIPVGVYAAVRRNSLFDRFANILAVAGWAIPTVWLGLMLILLFSVKFREWGMPFYLPVGGQSDLRTGGGFWDQVEHMILPTLALAIPSMAGWIVYIRASMLEVIQQDYIRTAKAKGLTEKTVNMRHGFRNALLPLITLVGLEIPALFGGSLVIENVFAWNGMGRLTIDAVTEKDYTVVMGTTIIFSVLVVMGNLIADVLYSVADPRIRRD
jgi:peptide/nickel transport system permease protein